jgi:hypothetical protein
MCEVKYMKKWPKNKVQSTMVNKKKMDYDEPNLVPNEKT